MYANTRTSEAVLVPLGAWRLAAAARSIQSSLATSFVYDVRTLTFSA